MTELQQLITEPRVNRNLLRMLADIPEGLLNDFITVLEPFDVATKLLSSDKKPTFHLVIPTRFQLIKQLTSNPTDSTITEQLKKHLLNFLKEKYHTHSLHFVATLLDFGIKGSDNFNDT